MPGVPWIIFRDPPSARVGTFHLIFIAILLVNYVNGAPVYPRSHGIQNIQPRSLPDGILQDEDFSWYPKAPALVKRVNGGAQPPPQPPPQDARGSSKRPHDEVAPSSSSEGNNSPPHTGVGGSPPHGPAEENASGSDLSIGDLIHDDYLQEDTPPPAHQAGEGSSAQAQVDADLVRPDKGKQKATEPERYDEQAHQDKMEAQRKKMIEKERRRKRLEALREEVLGRLKVKLREQESKPRPAGSIPPKCTGTHGIESFCAADCECRNGRLENCLTKYTGILRYWKDDNNAEDPNDVCRLDGECKCPNESPSGSNSGDSPPPPKEAPQEKPHPNGMICKGKNPFVVAMCSKDCKCENGRLRNCLSKREDASTWLDPWLHNMYCATQSFGGCYCGQGESELPREKQKALLGELVRLEKWAHEPENPLLLVQVKPGIRELLHHPNFDESKETPLAPALAKPIIILSRNAKISGLRTIRQACRINCDCIAGMLSNCWYKGSRLNSKTANTDCRDKGDMVCMGASWITIDPLALKTKFPDTTISRTGHLRNICNGCHCNKRGSTSYVNSCETSPYIYELVARLKAQVGANPAMNIRIDYREANRFCKLAGSAGGPGCECPEDRQPPANAWLEQDGGIGDVNAGMGDAEFDLDRQLPPAPHEVIPIDAGEGSSAQPGYNPGEPSPRDHSDDASHENLAESDPDNYYAPGHGH